MNRITTWLEVVALACITAGIATSAMILVSGPWGVVLALFSVALVAVLTSAGLTMAARPAKGKGRV